MTMRYVEVALTDLQGNFNWRVRNLDTSFHNRKHSPPLLEQDSPECWIPSLPLSMRSRRSAVATQTAKPANISTGSPIA
jgi:hypothetical protein